MKEKVTILIDDDELIHITWKLRAHSCGRDLRAFKTVEDFLSEAHSFAEDSPVFIDGNLGNGIRGEVESKKIHDLGFLNISIETGEPPESIQRPDWIKEVRGKTPPW